MGAMHAEHGVSIRQGCEAVGLPRRTSRYERRAKPDEPIIEALSALVERRHHDLLFLAATRDLILVIWMSTTSRAPRG